MQLSEDDLNRARRWGLLNNLLGLRVTLCGQFSLPYVQLEDLIDAAGGQVTHLSQFKYADAVVFGWGVTDIRGQVLSQSPHLQVWDEAQLVSWLLPDWAHGARGRAGLALGQ